MTQKNSFSKKENKAKTRMREKLSEPAQRFRIKYPKFLLLLISFILAYVFLTEKSFDGIRDMLTTFGYASTLIAGMFYPYGFTAALATASFLVLAESQNILIAAILGGLGALVGDYLIFRFIRHSFADEIELLSKESIVFWAYKNTPEIVRNHLVPLFACILIASPLPDEVGVTLLASTKNISTKQFAVLSFTLNAIGILAILAIGKAV